MIAPEHVVIGLFLLTAIFWCAERVVVWWEHRSVRLEQQRLATLARITSPRCLP